jgi:hypothetical protein
MLFMALSAQHRMASMSGLSHGSGLRTQNKSLETDACSAGCACSTNAAQRGRWAVSLCRRKRMAWKQVGEHDGRDTGIWLPEHP